MRKIGIALAALVLVTGCKPKVEKTPVQKILEIGISAEKALKENADKREASKDLKEMVELGKQEKLIIDTATASINHLLGGKNGRLPLPLGPCTDTLPVVFAHGSIGIPDFWHGEFKINLQIAGTEKRPLPEGTFFQLSALDAQGKVLFAKEGYMVDSLKQGDSLFAGGMFRAKDIQGLVSVAAK